MKTLFYLSISVDIEIKYVTIIFEIYDTNLLNPGKRDTYIEIKKRIPQSPNPDYAPLIFDLKDIKAYNEPVISKKVILKLQSVLLCNGALL